MNRYETIEVACGPTGPQATVVSTTHSLAEAVAACRGAEHVRYVLDTVTGVEHFDGAELGAHPAAAAAMERLLAAVFGGTTA